jgi:hypothetical protein
MLLMLQALPAMAEQVMCRVHLKQLCERDTGCRRVEANTWYPIDTVRATVSRCDARGCDTYQAAASQSGAFINLDVPGRGMLLKIASDGSNFVEVATLGLSVFVSFGVCARQ